MHVNMVTTLYQSIFFSLIQGRVRWDRFGDYFKPEFFCHEKRGKPLSFFLKHDFTNLTNQGYQYKSFEGQKKNTFPVYSENELKLAIDKPF